MYYEFYVDIFFLENIFMDFTLLLLTGQILHWKRRPGRILLGSFTGAMGAIGLLMLPAQGFFVTFCFGYVMTSALMIRIAFATQGKRQLIKGILYLYGITFLTGGIFQMLFSRITLPIVLAGCFSILILILLLEGVRGLKYKTQSIYDVTLSYHQRSRTVKGLRDTGNRLKEPIFGRPVCVADAQVMRELLDEHAKIFYIPYHSIGKKRGILPGITLDFMEIQRDRAAQRIEHPVVAISKEPVSSQGEYRILLNPMIIDE